MGNGLLYQAGGRTTVHGVAVKGSIRALDPTTGRVRWAVAEQDWILAPLAYANGLLVAGVGKTIRVLDAARGALLYSYTTSRRIDSDVCIANGMIYVGSGDGKLYAFGPPAQH